MGLRYARESFAKLGRANASTAHAAQNRKYSSVFKYTNIPRDLGVLGGFHNQRRVVTVKLYLQESCEYREALPSSLAACFGSLALSFRVLTPQYT